MNKRDHSNIHNFSTDWECKGIEMNYNEIKTLFFPKYYVDYNTVVNG